LKRYKTRWSDCDQLYTVGKLASSETGKVILPDDAVRKDKTVVIGAVLDPVLMHTTCRYFQKTGSFLYQSFNLVTTHAGLASLGFDVPSYSSLWVHLKLAPDSDQEAYLTEQLEQIAYRAATVDLHSYVAAAREKSELSMASFIVSLTHTEQLGLRTFVFPSWQPLAFVAILFLLSYAGIRRQIKKTAKGSIVENIREL